ncbi:MAG: putative repeat protein family [Frankiales bacterium]|nr:putative repeat protein family [Frankiales bacterium]
MSFRSSTRVLGSIVAITVPLVLGGMQTSASAATVDSGGFAEAYGLLIDATLLQGNVPVTVGPLAPVASSCPPASGVKTTQLLGAGDPTVARADVLNTGAATDCSGNKSLASAQTTNVTALGAAAPLKIETDEITATSGTTCATAPKGSTVIANLKVGGTAVPLPTDIPPNTDLLPQLFGPLGIRVILNEQHPAASGRGLVVNGLHIIAAGAGALPIGGAVIRGDVIISHAVSGVVCPGGPGSDNGGLPKPDISFTKVANPTTAKPGEKVTYTATVTNTSTTPCEVLKFVEHVSPAFNLGSSAGAFGTALDTPAPVRTDGGVDAVLRPTGLTIAPGKSAVQTFTVTVKPTTAPGTYYDSLEIYCGLNGNFVSGPLAPVTVPAAAAPAPPAVTPPVDVAGPAAPQLPRTGGSPLPAAAALVLLASAAVIYRKRLAQL